MLSKILVAIDGSSDGKKALDLAIDLAKSCGSTVTVTYVVHERVYIALQEAGYNALPAIMNNMEEYGKKVLEEAKAVVETAGVKVDTALLLGLPAKEILKKSEAGKYDMVVVGKRGRTGARSFLMGSVSDNVSHHAKCPVLIVR